MSCNLLQIASCDNPFEFISQNFKNVTIWPKLVSNWSRDFPLSPNLFDESETGLTNPSKPFGDTWTLSALETLRNALYKFQTYLYSAFL